MSDRVWTAIAASTDLAEGVPFEAVVDETILVVIRHQGAVKAFQGLCPHQFARLAKGRVTDGVLNCPHHMAKFDLTDGTCGPGWDLPALRKYAVREDGGTVSVCIGASG